MKGNTQTGRTILHETVAFSHENLVREILEHCLSPVFTELPDSRGDTALMLAIKLNNFNLVKLFINRQKHRVTINTKTKESILHMAVSNDNYEIFKLLLSNTDVQLLGCPNPTGMTPLLHAGEQNSLKCLKLLLSKGYIHTTNSITKETLLHFAIKCNNVLILSEITTLKSLHWFVKQKDNQGKTPFWSAIEAGNHLGIKSFLMAGWIDINELNENGESCIFVSAKYGFIKVLKSLLLSDKYYSFCKNYASQLNVQNINVLNDAEIRGDTYSTDLFVLFGEEPKTNAFQWIPKCLFTQNKNGQNIFHACALSGNIDCLKFMHTYFKTLKLNLKLFDKKSNEGDTPLMLATESGLDGKDCVIFFLENGSDITSVNNKNMSVLKSIILHSPKPTDLLIRVLNSFIKGENLTSTLEEEHECMGVNFSILIPNSQPQITTVKLLDDTLKGKDKIKIMQHSLIKIFVHLKWINVKSMFIISFIVTCISTVLLSLYLTFTIIEPKSKFTALHTIGSPLLILLNFEEIISSLSLLTLKNIWMLSFTTVMSLIPCLSTIFYILFNNESQVMQELASICVLMSWLRLLMYSAIIFEEISRQVTMLSNVLFSICKYLAILLVTIFSFSMCFFCIFSDYNDFSNPLFALMYTLFVMLQGELNDSFLYFLNKHYFITNDTTSTKDSIESTLIKNIDLLIESSILLLFVLVCVIGLLNMLVSLAVRDGSTLAADGEVFQRHLQIQWLNNLEAFFESKCFSVLEKTRLIYLLGILPKMKELSKLKLSYNRIIGKPFSEFNSELVSDMKKTVVKSSLMHQFHHEVIRPPDQPQNNLYPINSIIAKHKELNNDLKALNNQINELMIKADRPSDNGTSFS